MARIAAWLLHSRGRLYGSIAGLVALVVFFALPSGEDDPAPAAPRDFVAAKQAETYTPPATPAPYMPPAATAAPTAPPVSTERQLTSADPLAVAAATGLVAAWLDTDNPDWPAVDQYATPRLAKALRTVDPRRVPSGKVSGAEPLVIGSTYHEVQVAIGEGRSVRVALALQPDGWRAVDLQP